MSCGQGMVGLMVEYSIMFGYEEFAYRCPYDEASAIVPVYDYCGRGLTVIENDELPRHHTVLGTRYHRPERRIRSGIANRVHFFWAAQMRLQP